MRPLVSIAPALGLSMLLATSGSIGCDGGVESELGEPADSAAFAAELRRVLEDPPDLLARIAISPAQALEMYRLGNSLLLSETGLAGSTVTTLSDADKALAPIELYRKLVPGAPIPTRLSAFLQNAQRSDLLAPPPSRPTEEVAPITQAFFEDYVTGFGPGGKCPLSWFISQRSFYGNFCPTGSGYFDRWCLGDKTWAFREYPWLWETTATICVDRGTSPFWIEGGVEGNRLFNQPAGTWRQVRMAQCRSSGCVWNTIKYDIEPGGVFQFGGYYKNRT